MRVLARVEYRAAYFNRTCNANIPARWCADVTSDLPKGSAIYVDGCATRADAIRDLVAELRRFGMTGTLKIEGRVG